MMSVKVSVAVGSNLEASLDFVPVQMNEHPAVGQMVRRNRAEEAPIIEISKGFIPCGPVEPRKSVYAFKNWVISIVHLSKHFGHGHRCIVRIADAGGNDVNQSLGGG